MKFLKKAVAVLLVSVMVASLSACGKAGDWIVKAEDTELPVGTYISYLYSFYVYACYMAEDTSASPIGQKVSMTADNGEVTKRDAVEWIKETAMNNCKAVLNILVQCQKAGLTLDKNELASAEQAAQNDYDTYAGRYEACGVSMNSLRVLYQYTALTQKLMNHLYGNDGMLDPISDASVRDYYLKNYTYTEYFTVSLASETEGSSSYKKLISYAESLAAQVSDGAMTMDKAVAKYNADYDASLTVTSDRDLLENLDYASNLKGVSNNACVAFVSGNTLYILLKHDIAEDTEYLESNLTGIRSAMCRDDYNAYLDEAEAALTFEINEAAVEKYSPRWMEKQIEKAQNAA